MERPLPQAAPSFTNRPHVHASRVRRLLLEQARYALTTEPAVLESRPDLPVAQVINIRSRASLMVGAIVVRLNLEGFTQSDRLYAMRDDLADGRPVDPRDLAWLSRIISRETGATSGFGGLPPR